MLFHSNSGAPDLISQIEPKYSNMIVMIPVWDNSMILENIHSWEGITYLINSVTYGLQRIQGEAWSGGNLAEDSDATSAMERDLDLPGWVGGSPCLVH